MTAFGLSPGPGGSMIVTADGDLDVLSRDEFAAALAEALRGGHHVIVDLSAVRFMDSTAVAVIVRQWKQARQAGAALVLASVRDLPARVLRLTGVAERLPVYEDVAQAAASLPASAPDSDERPSPGATPATG